MTDVSNSDDVIDVRDIIARVEELEGQRQPWTAGFNMPGYMPDSEPCTFESFDDARDYIATCLEEIAEDAAMGDDAAHAAKVAAMIDAAKPRVEALTEGEFGETIGNYHYWIAPSENEGLEPADHAELVTLRELLSNLEGNGGDEQWNGSWYPLTLIRDDHFESYAEELAEDCCPYPSNSPEGKALQQWPYRCIDWKQAARELQQDYSSVEFDGVTYWYR